MLNHLSKRGHRTIQSVKDGIILFCSIAVLERVQQLIKEENMSDASNCLKEYVAIQHI